MYIDMIMVVRFSGKQKQTFPSFPDQNFQNSFLLHQNKPNSTSKGIIISNEIQIKEIVQHKKRNAQAIFLKELKVHLKCLPWLEIFCIT